VPKLIPIIKHHPILGLNKLVSSDLPQKRLRLIPARKSTREPQPLRPSLTLENTKKKCETWQLCAIATIWQNRKITQRGFCLISVPNLNERQFGNVARAKGQISLIGPRAGN